MVKTELKKQVRNIWLSGKVSSTLIIPISTARKYGFDKHTSVIVEEKEDGILIKKLEV
jgi:hypothetical protein